MIEKGESFKLRVALNIMIHVLFILNPIKIVF